jgi:hypothetical protein
VNQLPLGAFEINSSSKLISIDDESVFIEKEEPEKTDMTKNEEEIKEEEFTDDYFEPIVYLK